MSASFTFTSAMLADVRTAVAIVGGDAPDTVVARSVGFVADWLSTGAMAKDLAIVLSTPDRKVTARQCEPFVYAVRLLPLIKSAEDVTGATEAVRLLNGNGVSVKSPARLLAAWTKDGKTFASWDAARKALTKQRDADRAVAVEDTAPESGEDETGEDETGNGGIAGSPTLASEAARIGNDALAAAEALGVDVAALLEAVVSHVMAMNAAAAAA